MPAGELRAVSHGDASLPSAFLSLLPTLFTADESRVPLGDADQSGVPEHRAQSQEHPQSVRGPGQRLLLQLVPSTPASWYQAPQSPTFPRKNTIFSPFNTPFPPTHLSSQRPDLLPQLPASLPGLRHWPYLAKSCRFISDNVDVEPGERHARLRGRTRPRVWLPGCASPSPVPIAACGNPLYTRRGNTIGFGEGWGEVMEERPPPVPAWVDGRELQLTPPHFLPFPGFGKCCQQKQASGELCRE